MAPQFGSHVEAENKESGGDDVDRSGEGNGRLRPMAAPTRGSTRAARKTPSRHRARAGHSAALKPTPPPVIARRRSGTTARPTEDGLSAGRSSMKVRVGVIQGR